MTLLQNDYRADETKEFHRLLLITVTWFRVWAGILKHKHSVLHKNDHLIVSETSSCHRNITSVKLLFAMRVLEEKIYSDRWRSHRWRCQSELPLGRRPWPAPPAAGWPRQWQKLSHRESGRTTSAPHTPSPGDKRIINNNPIVALSAQSFFHNSSRRLWKRSPASQSGSCSKKLCQREPIHSFHSLIQPRLAEQHHTLHFHFSGN